MVGVLRAGVGRRRHVRREELLRGSGWQGGVHRSAQSVLRSHSAGVQILLGNHHNFGASDGRRQVADQFFLILELLERLN